MTRSQENPKQILNHIRQLDGGPAPPLKSKIYCAYRDGPKEPGWNVYPAWSFHPKFRSPLVQSELVIFDGPALELLRLAPGWKQSKDDHPELFRSLLVPESLESVVRLVGGISNLCILPEELSATELIHWLKETFRNQSFERIVNLSLTPRGAWLADLTHGIVDSSRRDGLFFSGMNPSLRSGPATYLYFRCLKRSQDLPLRAGPFHALLSGVTTYSDNQAISAMQTDVKKASDFRKGMHHPKRPLVVLAPSSEPGTSSIRGWARLADHLIEERQREVAVFFDQTEGKLKKSMDRETGGQAAFVNRWLKTPAQRAAFLRDAEGMISANSLSSLLAIRLGVPVLHGGQGIDDLMNPGDLRLVLEKPFSQPKSLAELYGVLGDMNSPLPHDLPGGRVERELDDTEPFRALPRTRPGLEQNPAHVKQFIFKNSEYRICHILNNLVERKIPSIPHASIRDRYQLRFGEQVNRDVVKNVINNLRKSLSDLESRIRPEIDGIDPSPPSDLSEEAQEWFEIFQPLWTFRAAASGDKQQGKIQWGVRYFFRGCRSTLQSLERI